MDRFDGSVSDSELLEDFARTGNEDSFNVLVQHYKLGLFNTAFRILQDRHAAEDVVQKVFIRLIERKNELTEIESLQPWLYRTAVNVSLNVKKSISRRKERETSAATSAPAESPREAAAKAELRKEIDSALTRLKDSLRIPLVLRYLQGMSHAETGEVLNASPDAIRMRIHRALRKLRKLLRGRGLIIPILAVEEGLRTLPAKAASANFLPSASSVIKAASTAGLAAKAAVTTTSIVKGGLIMTAKGKLAIATAILATGTLTYLATRARQRDETPGTSPPAATEDQSFYFPQDQTSDADQAPSSSDAAEDESKQLKGSLWGHVVDVEGNAIPEATVEAGVFEGDSPTDLVRKPLVRSTTTDAAGRFVFRDRTALSRAARVLKDRRELPQKLPGALHGLLITIKEGYFPTRTPVEFDPLPEPLTVVLKQAPQVAGRVVWKESGKPIAGVNVVCEPEKSDLYSVSKIEDLTNDQGTFTLTVPAEGEAKIWPDFLWGRKKGKESKTQLVPGEVEEFVFRIELLSDTVIMGRVTDAEANPIAGTELLLSTEKGFAGPTKTREDGRYMLGVDRTYPYRSYDLEDWPENPRLRASSSRFSTRENMRQLPDGTWDWKEYWIPPPNSPAERLVAFHRDYEMQIVDVPALGIAQIRENVDVVLYKGSKVSGRVMDENSVGLDRIKIYTEVLPEEGNALVENDNGVLRYNPVISGDDGTYEINSLREGVYTVFAHHAYWKYDKKRLQIGPHEVVEGFDFVLVRGNGLIEGEVMDEEGNPWPHGKVWARAGDYFYRHESGRRAQTKEDGTYELTNLKPIKYNLWLDVSEDYWQGDEILWASFLKDVPTGTHDANITVRKLRGGALRIVVLDEAQKPITEFELACCPLRFPNGRNGIPLDVGKCDKGQFRTFSRSWERSGVVFLRKNVVSESGEFLFNRVFPGTYFVSVESDKKGRQFREVEISGGQETEAVFELKSLCRIEGIVLDQQRHPLEGVEVKAAKMREFSSTPERVWVFNDTYGYDYEPRPYEPVFRTVRSGPDGRFVLDNLEQTEYRVITTRRDVIVDRHGRWYSVCADVTPHPGLAQLLELVLGGGTGRIEGCVVGQDGRRNYVQVALIGNGRVTRVHSDKQGNYFIEDVPAGRYRVISQTWAWWGRARHEGREIELREGEHLRLDIVAEGDGAVQGSISLAGDAARAAEWYSRRRDQILVLRNLREDGSYGGMEMRSRVDAHFETFEWRNVPSGKYEASAFVIVNIKPFGNVSPGEGDFYDIGECRAQFASEPQIIEVAPGSSTPINLTVSEACAPHYPIPDPADCENFLIVEP